MYNRDVLKGYWYVYRATHIATGRHYVGLTNDFERRKREHLKAARTGSQQYIHRAIRKHGADAFEWVVIGRCSSLELASQSEQIAVKQLDAFGNGFNMTTGGESRWTKVTRDETKKKLAALYLGKTYEQLHGAEKASDIRRRQSGPRPQSKWSQERKRAQSECNRERWKTGCIGKKGRPCIVRGVAHKNVATAARANGVTKPAVQYWIRKAQHGSAFL